MSNKPRQFKISAARLLMFGLLFAAMTALGIYVVYQQQAGQSLRFDSRLLSWQSVISMLALLCVYFIADGLRLYYTLRALGEDISFRDLFRLVFINIFFSNITPMATGGGLAQIWYLQRHGMKLGTATAATTIRTLLAVIFIFALTPICLLTLDVLKNQPVLSNSSTILTLLIIGYLGFFWWVLVHTRQVVCWCARFLGVLQRFNLIDAQQCSRWQYKVRREMLRFSHCFRLYLRGPARYLWLSVFYTLVFLAALFSFPALLIYALGYQVDYLLSTGLLVVTTFIMYFAPTPGASGISEGVFGSFFKGILGVEHLLLVTLCWRFLTIYLGMAVGLVMTQAELLRDKKHE
ncbi:lysylphosphatidylglycerol synthase transmembrane domain-containing protein [Chromatiaceae bacterium AAb-1]|nr:lysylphosphatidylglycerol synthase transmembrane domain-containing protein [Chromatiaceae bacterium AAb-1]